MFHDEATGENLKPTAPSPPTLGIPRFTGSPAKIASPPVQKAPPSSHHCQAGGATGGASIGALAIIGGGKSAARSSLLPITIASAEIPPNSKRRDFAIGPT